MADIMIPLASPFLNGNEWRYVKECLDSGWVSTAGPFIDRFEKAVASYVGSPFAVGMVNGTSALHIAMLLVGVLPGDEVIVPTLTFISPVNAVGYAGATPVFMDVDPLCWQMDVSKIESFLKNECETKAEGCFNKKTGKRVRAIVAVHLLGLSCEIDQIVQLAKKFKLKVIEDAAEGLGVRYREKHIGTFGDVGVVSFNGNKIATSGGGGMVITASSQMADDARYLSTQAKDDALEYIHNTQGYNYRLTNIHAAIGLAQLEQIDFFIEKKRFIASYYREMLQPLPGLNFMPLLATCEATYWLSTILLPPKISLEQRKQVVKKLNEQGIGARPFWHTIHDLPMHQNAQSYLIEHAPHFYRRGISLPSSCDLEVGTLKQICEKLVSLL